MLFDEIDRVNFRLSYQKINAVALGAKAGFLNELIKCEQVLKFIQKPLTVGEVDCRKARRRGLSHTNLCPLSQLTLTAPPKWEPLKLDLLTNCLLVQKPWTIQR